jgi:hypothetical protein
VATTAIEMKIIEIKRAIGAFYGIEFREHTMIEAQRLNL